jgi:hypothetical protein
MMVKARNETRKMIEQLKEEFEEIVGTQSKDPLKGPKK